MPGKARVYTIILFSLFSLLITHLGPATAAPAPHTGWNHSSRLAAKHGVSLEQAVARVQRETGGRILTAETINRNGRAVHRIKVLLPNGNVRVVHVEAE